MITEIVSPACKKNGAVFQYGKEGPFYKKGKVKKQ
jgi:hypothetical protein